MYTQFFLGMTARPKCANKGPVEKEIRLLSITRLIMIMYIYTYIYFLPSAVLFSVRRLFPGRLAMRLFRHIRGIEDTRGNWSNDEIPSGGPLEQRRWSSEGRISDVMPRPRL